MSDWYYVDASRIRRGPYEPAALKALAVQGEIHAETRVWRGGMARWQSLAECAAELELDTRTLAAAPVVVSEPEAPARPEATPPPELTALAQAQADALADRHPSAEPAEPPELPDADPAARHLAPVWHHAGLAKRFAAFMIDELILTVALMPVVLIVALITGGAAGSPEAAAVNLLRLVATWFYFSWCESSSLRGTIGKRALGLYVTRPHGAGLSFGRASARFLAKILGAMAFMIGIFLIAVHPQRQGLHDQVTDTYVVADNAEKLHLKPFEWILIALGVFVVLVAMSTLQAP
ncbi:MAG: RDD family protein [Xanthomonadales bacterium]|jgi:uncharacterized RDD family membrane protein YckC|nr:RDD family protein [Xanthomonadales bacterium]